MDELQVIALVLEIFGFSIAYIHIFKRSISIKIEDYFTKKLLDLKSFYTIYIGGAIDYTSNLSDEDKKMAGKFRSVKSLIVLVLFIYFFNSIDFGDGILWGGLEIFTLLIIVSFASIFLTMIILPLFNHLLQKIIDLIFSFGKGSFIAGIGLIFAIAGILIETYQVYMSIYWWIALSVWSFAFIIGCLLYEKKDQ